MSELQQYQTLVLALIATATATFGWLYSRRLGVAAVQKALNETHQDLIAALETKARLLQTEIGDLDRRLKRCERLWTMEKSKRREAKRRSELIG